MLIYAANPCMGKNIDLPLIPVYDYLNPQFVSTILTKQRISLT